MFSCYVYLIKSTKYLGIDLIEDKWCDNVGNGANLNVIILIQVKLVCLIENCWIIDWLKKTKHHVSTFY